MSESSKWAGSPAVVCRLLGSVERCRMIAALCGHEWMPSSLLARAARLTRTAGSQQLALLRKGKIVEVGMGRLYRLHPSLRPAPGVEFVDFGCLRLMLANWA
jgi:hypothetical protein